MIKKLVIAAISIIAISGCSQEPAPQAAGGGQPPPPTVSVLEVVLQPVENTVTLPGRVSPLRQSQVRPQVEGVITERLFEEGAFVEKGQQLYQIDDSRYAAQLASAKADVKSAEANRKTLEAKAERFKGLLNKNAVSQQEYDDAIAQAEQADAQISVAKAAVELAQVDLDFTKVYAPISGQISRSYMTVGALVTSNQTQQLATITQLDPIYVDMQQSGKGILKLRRAMQESGTLPVTLVLDDMTGESYEHTGELKFSEVTVDETTGAVALRAEFPNPDSLLMPGMFTKARVNISNTQEILVPQRAATRQPDTSLSVMVVNAENKVEARTITIAGSYGDQYIVTSGVAAGDKVIVAGYQKVKPGAQVNTKPWQPQG
ncbi:MAG TPA: efflux RND transporter periplasmic adaptor subunit [Alteromonas sp.]|jgi:membrane fusion protein (multidrug efflux system)|nr:efflux transporter periplasmic adaptor subunit [Alteromonas sp.]HAU92911.1 efflux RND transporter periplasmic adaptor subunit [Alteromonas sp.]HCB18496.1 efflux RND transporter periplasmic adaptor subunit [Alteromonas sp.]|tara:strand:+ start:4790 stop:5914 length:1125 start_codon:yes stop_codon:yes gene_type:complete